VVRRAAGPRDRRVSGVSVVAQAEKAPAATVAHAVPSPITSVLSARRVPELIAAPVADNRLIAHLTDLMSDRPSRGASPSP